MLPPTFYLFLEQRMCRAQTLIKVVVMTSSEYFTQLMEQLHIIIIINRLNCIHYAIYPFYFRSCSTQDNGQLAGKGAIQPGSDINNGTLMQYLCSAYAHYINKQYQKFIVLEAQLFKTLFSLCQSFINIYCSICRLSLFQQSVLNLLRRYTIQCSLAQFYA